MGVIDVDAGGVVEAVFDGLDGLFTSDEEKAAAKLKLTEVMQKPHVLQAIANIESAKNTNWFVAGGRPSLLWICAIALLYNWIIKDFMIIGIVVTATKERAEEIIPLLPLIDGAEVTGLVLALLGLAGLRSYDKKNGVARDAK